MRGATDSDTIDFTESPISTPTPHARRDALFKGDVKRCLDFYSHASCEARRHRRNMGEWNRSRFLLPRLMRGATLVRLLYFFVIRISTPTPHARRDERIFECAGLLEYFYSHASCEARPCSIHQSGFVH